MVFSNITWSVGGQKYQFYTFNNNFGKLDTVKYRVFNNEGQKVLGYETMKKCVFEATKKLIALKNMGHFLSSSLAYLSPI